MIIYILPGTCSLSPMIACEWGELPYTVCKLERGQQKSDAYKQINPDGQVPAIQLDDGRVLLQNVALALHIADRSPDAKLGAPLNSAERDRLYFLLAYLGGEFHKSFLPVFAGDKFIDDSKLEGIDKDKMKSILRSAATEQIKSKYQRIAREIRGPYLMGEHPCVADAYLFAMARWAPSAELFRVEDVAPEVAELQARLGEDEGVKRALAAEQGDEEAARGGSLRGITTFAE